MWIIRFLVFIYGIGYSVTQQTTTEAPIPEIDLSTCGITKSCYRAPQGCTQCNFIVTWTATGPDHVDFELQGSTDDNRDFIAVGLTKSSSMGGSSVTDCIYTGDVIQPVTIQMSHNEAGYGNTVLNQPLLGLVESKLEGSYTDDRITCRFSRNVTVTGTEADKVFDLNEEYYVIMARGPVTAGAKQYHGTTKVRSSVMVNVTSGDFVNIGAPSTSSTTTVLPPKQAPIPEIDLSTCGITKSCYRAPQGCTQCNFIVTWTPAGPDHVDFELQGSTGDNRDFIAVGLSKSSSMAGSSVTDCIYTGDVIQPVTIQMSHNAAGYSNTVLNQPLLGLVESKLEGSYTDDRITCRFSRNVTVTGTEADKVFDLDEEYYVIMARGPVTAGLKQYHGTTKVRSSVMVNVTLGDFVNIGAPSTASTTTVLSPTQESIGEVDLSDCGISKGCYRDPADCTECDYIVTWRSAGDNLIDFEIQGTTTDNKNYIALGMSRNQRMLSTSVTDCIYTGDASRPVDVQMSYNADDAKANLVLEDKYLGLVDGNSEGYFGDGRITCRFTRYITLPPTTRWRRQTTDADRVFDLDDPFYLLLARGTVDNGLKSYHANTKIISPVRADVTSTQYINIGGTASNPFIKAHGILMILAWMVSASFAVLMPRYFKTAWSNKQWGGKAIWFQIHMPLMVITLFLTVAGFILIFVSVKGYAQYPDLPQKAHPPLGIITTGLVIINPIMAACRPHPGTPRRPIFNVFHFIVGLCAHLCAITTIFLAMYMEKANPPAWGRWVMVAFICWHALIEFILAIHMHCCHKADTPSRHKYEVNYEEDDISKAKNHQDDSKKNIIITTLVGLHLAGVVAMALALIIPIARA